MYLVNFHCSEFPEACCFSSIWSKLCRYPTTFVYYMGKKKIDLKKFALKINFWILCLFGAFHPQIDGVLMKPGVMFFLETMSPALYVSECLQPMLFSAWLVCWWFNAFKHPLLRIRFFLNIFFQIGTSMSWAIIWPQEHIWLPEFLAMSFNYVTFFFSPNSNSSAKRNWRDQYLRLSNFVSMMERSKNA